MSASTEIHMIVELVAHNSYTNLLGLQVPLQVFKPRN